jgi:sirohydrochlorin cobaltochelatase
MQLDPAVRDPAVVLCGHGTRRPEGVAQFEAMVAALRARHPARRIAHACLELAPPSLDDTVARLHAHGERDLLVVPVFLFAAGHLKREVPEILGGIRERHPDVAIRLGAPLGLAPGVLETACRVAERATEGAAPVAGAATCLLVIGRGTSDPDANAEAARLARLVVERLGWGFATTGYVAVTGPSVPEALALVEHLPFARVVVLPLVLFDGRLHQGIARAVDEVRARSAREWLLAAPFCTDDAWLRTLDSRIAGET